MNIDMLWMLAIGLVITSSGIALIILIIRMKDIKVGTHTEFVNSDVRKLYEGGKK